jgi:putative membrane protein
MTLPKTILFAAISIVATVSVAHAQAGLNDLEIAHAAYTADLIDIEYAKIALSKTKSADVKTFAELMIRDHTAVNEGAGKLLKKCRGQGQ